MLVDELAVFLAERLAASGESRAATLTGAVPRRFADAPTRAPFAAPAARATGYELIQDTQHSGVFTRWPRGMPLPPGFVPVGNLPLALARLRFIESAFIGGGLGVTVGAPLGLIRLSAREAVDAVIARRQREARERKEAELERQRQQRGLPPLARPGRPPRPSRPARRPRAPRQARQARPARPRRVPGTKNTKPRSDCLWRNSLGRCNGNEPCISTGVAVNPNEGHSSCNWGPVDNCGNCVKQGCTGPAAGLLKPFLALLPKYWSQEPAAAPPRQPPPVPSAQRAPLKFKQLPALSPGASAPVTAAPPLKFRIPAGGCGCSDWPGFIICPNCAGGPRWCACRSTCTPFPPSAGQCALP